MIELLFICFGTACLSHFLEMCMNDGGIFNWYLGKIVHLPNWLFKPLGGCLYCFSTWIYIITILFVTNIYGFICNPIILFLGLGFNFLFVKLIDKYAN